MKNTETKNVTVTVGSDGQPVCSPDPVTVKGKDVHLKFELQTAGYVFPATDAVVVSNPGSQFPESSKTLPPGNTTAKLLDRNTETGEFKYTVSVQQTSSGRVTQLDPTIVNEL